MGRPSTKESLPPVWVIYAGRSTAPEVRGQSRRNKARRTQCNRKRATTATTHYDQIQTPFASSFMRRSVVTPTGDVEASSLCIEASSLYIEEHRGASSLYVEASRPGL